MYNQHRGLAPPPQGGSARLNELLDGIRAEFENQARASGEYEHSSKRAHSTIAAGFAGTLADFSFLTVAQQINEMQMVREKVYTMEQTHLALKQK
jgi:glucose repression regulatory protein TUP1